LITKQQLFDIQFFSSVLLNLLHLINDHTYYTIEVKGNEQTVVHKLLYLAQQYMHKNCA